MAPPAPLLLDLDAFPQPPTFIPSPSTPQFSNPPPSRPPLGPLPPVPGPSRISDADTLLFLQSTGVSRSRRSSKLSFNGNRDSIASTRSDSLLSISTPQTPSSPAHSLHQPSLVFSVDEHDEPSDDLLANAPLIQKAPLDELEDLSVAVPSVMPTPRLPRTTPPRTHQPRRESIALNSVAIPTTDSDTEPDFDALDSPAEPTRAVSPDITSILATTPRPRLNSLSRGVASVYEPWEEDFIDDYGKQRDTIFSVSSKRSNAFTFGFPDSTRSEESLHSVAWDDPHESDSDLDLHTSLPQLMLQHGFLSPQSKLLTEDTPTLTPSSASTSRTKTVPPRDTRDTPKRRVRHRDGKLLRGGIGLTTGLGWSDSEDEDAPSALTRRISSLDLNRSRSQLGLSRSSSLATSARTSTFSRSISHARRAQSEYDDTDTDEFGVRLAKDSAPPTSWQRRSDPTSRLSRVQSQSSLRRMPSIQSEESTSTTTSAMSLPLMRSRSRVLRVMAADKEKPLPSTPHLRRGPSNASLIRPRAVTGVTHPLSIVPPSAVSMKSTPQPGGLPPTPLTPGGSRSLRPLRLQPRMPVLGGDRAPVPVPAVISVGGLSSSVSSSSASTESSNLSTSSSGLSTSTSATSMSLLSASPSYARAPSPYGPPSPALTPTSSGFASVTPTPTTPSFGPSTPTTPMSEHSGIARPRPRTGTGMAYRSSTYGGLAGGSGGRGPGIPVRAPTKLAGLAL
ncbi:Ribosomal protein 60S [Mycena indigotica]|uniref:Ribosomal protein 60S n=1 Tax=Mycena indigotica TaxID=2126181 RepID=A0A8H6T5D0_9AGAR|nr:Ribosomal protein 60S [Mycena indigotica]KAF7309715.1 Ribosomal protein 60S [Mycena indigotica]